MKAENTELLSNIAKYVGVTVATPFVVVGGVLSTAALATYFFLDRVAFKNWKTTTVSLLTAGTLFFSSEYGKPVRDITFDYLNNKLHTDIEVLEKENNKLEQTIVDTANYFQAQIETKLDSVNLVKSTEIRIRNEINKKNLTNLEKKLEKQETYQTANTARISQVEKNQKTMVGYLQHNTTTIENVGDILKAMQAQNEMSKNKDLEKIIYIRQPKQNTYTKTNSANSKINSSTTYWTTIDKGESLSKIAEEYYGAWDSYKKIAKENGIKDPNKIEIGQPIKLPISGLKKKNGLNNSEFPTNTIIITKGDNLTNKLARDRKLSWNQAKTMAEKIVSYNKKIGNEYATTGTVKYNKLVVSLN